MLQQNLVLDPARGRLGLVTASVGGRPCHDHVWTRDSGVFLRELAHVGLVEHGLLVSRALIELVAPNARGFLAYPQHVHLGQGPASGDELDGTAAIVIGMVALWQRTPLEHPDRARLLDFLLQPTSPARFLRDAAAHGLIGGSGEFGGGMGVSGLYCNVVQNHLAAVALQQMSRLEDAIAATEPAALDRQAAARLMAGLLAHLVAEDGGWLWCVDARTLAADPQVLAAHANQGFGGINGVLAMHADSGDLVPDESGWAGMAASRAVFARLLSEPRRRDQFARFGMWSQFDRERDGLLTSPSYGQGYAIQCLLLMDRLEEAARALGFLARATAQPPCFLTLDRRSRYHFYERYYAPDAQDRCVTDEGCGALNLVNVAEPLKAARLILGIDDQDPARLRIVPRLPDGWDEATAEDWPVRTTTGVYRADVRISRLQRWLRVELTCDHGQLPLVAVRSPLALGGAWQELTDVTAVAVDCL